MSSPSFTRHLTNFFALNRNTSILLAALVSMGFAEELWMRFLPKYLESLGAAVWAIGLFDAIKTWIGAVYAYPGGLIADRWGLRKALSSFTLLSLAGYIWLARQPALGVGASVSVSVSCPGAAFHCQPRFLWLEAAWQRTSTPWASVFRQR